ncbi:sensor histidine kinase [Vagococcus elongatus]|uniref:histidine kinase n=1 Tax=Vagococcus elongatus TaxID=180344 RepID=A0A430AHR6_9ENTE|nr:sensor histidine kinase [Vagococcus elongatus]RSU07649.1 hypothetical protein CBF29_13220 [Vagococcus elongatus]
MIKRKSHTLQTKLLITFGTIFTITIWLVALIIFKESEKILATKIGEARVDTLHQISERSVQINNSIHTLVNLYANDSTIKTSLQKNLSKEGKNLLTIDIETIKKKYDISFKDIGLVYDITIIGKNNFNYSSNMRGKNDFIKLSQQLWYKKITNSNKIYFNSFNDRFTSPEKATYVYSAAKIITDTKGALGVVLISIHEELLSDIFSDHINNGEIIYIVDNTGQVVAHPHKNFLGKKYIGLENFKKLYGYNNFNIINKHNENYLLTSYYDSKSKWLIIEEMPTNLIYKDLDRTKIFIFTIACISNISILIITVFFSKKISLPISSLSKTVNQLKKGDLSVQTDVSGYQEIESLGVNFNKMVLDLNELIRKNIEKEEQKRISELAFLRSQINPHFIHNTLFSIKCLIDLNKNSEAIEMLEAFTTLTKETFNVNQEFITLEKECEAVRSYIMLQQIRYGEKIQFEIDLDRDTKDLLVPALLLQPIVENAIFHGIEPKKEFGMVIITSKLNSYSLQIQVSDDGVGMPNKKIEMITQKKNALSHSIGLSNVQTRIQLLYGEKYGLSISSELNIGTVVTIRLPLSNHKI